jgi:hypothetical protein
MLCIGGYLLPSNRTNVSGGLEPRYRSWEQVGGYFDGDGNVGLEIVKRVLHLRIRFVDTWKPQIETIMAFLVNQGIATGCLGQDNKTAKSPVYRLEVGQIASVLRTAKELFKHCVKKREDLRITIDYLEGRITGNEAIAAFNEEVVNGRRRGVARDANIPYTREEGIRLSKLEIAEKARAAYAVHVPPVEAELIRSDHTDKGLGSFRLAKKYGYSEKVIRRILASRPT